MLDGGIIIGPDLVYVCGGVIGFEPSCKDPFIVSVRCAGARKVLG